MSITTNELEKTTCSNIEKRRNSVELDDKHINKKIHTEHEDNNIVPCDNDNQETRTKCLKTCAIDEKRRNSDESEENELENKEVPSENDEKSADQKLTLFNGKDVNSLSKSQLKKYKKMLSWQANKKEKRMKERIKAKQRKAEARLNNIDLGPSRKQLKQSKMCDSSCKTSVIIDLSFDDLMIPKDMGKVIKQVLRVYTENRRSKTPMQLHLTSFEGRCKEEMSKHDGYENWDCNFHSENYIDIFPKDKLVYLSSESDNVIKELEQDKMYIIGGLVDHNAHKGLCFNKAVEQGISHGQLPIGDFFNIKTRKVFTINQVFEILLRVSEGLSFKEAFEKVLPQRINIIPNDVSSTTSNK